MLRTLTLILVLAATGCSKAPATRPDGGSQATKPDADGTTETNTGSSAGAEIVEVSISGDAGAYNFDVTIASPDTGCEQYADWWEVVSEDEGLIYRRILTHSHVDEQPFTRSGGPVAIEPDANVYVRLHMNNTGYSPFAAQISPDGALELLELADDFAANLETAAPQPDGCAF